MKYLLPLLCASLLFAAPNRVLLLSINTENDPELGSHLLTTVTTSLSNNQSISLIPPKEVNLFASTENLEPGKDLSKIVAHFNTQQPIDAAITIILAPLSVNKQRQILWVTGEQHYFQSAELLVTTAADSTLFSGTLTEETIISTGYCGIFTCTQANLSAVEHVKIHKDILKKLGQSLTKTIDRLIFETP
ncbi:MAG: hypothetical protein OCC49_15725 [Fibrobacterales bacterium]